MSRYATIQELKDVLNIASSGDDAELQLWLDAAEAAIDLYCNREDGFLAVESATARYYIGSGSTYQHVDECVEVTEVAVKDSITADNYTAWNAPTSPWAGDGDWYPAQGSGKRPTLNRTPYHVLLVDVNGDYTTFTDGRTLAQRGWPTGRGQKVATPTVKVTARWGYADTAPPTVRQASIAQAGRWYKRGSGGWTDSLASAEHGELTYRKAVDPDIKMMLVHARLVRPAVGGGVR